MFVEGRSGSLSCSIVESGELHNILIDDLVLIDVVVEKSFFFRSFENQKRYSFGKKA